MKVRLISRVLEKIKQRCVLLVGYFAGLGVASILILAWVATGPIFELKDRMTIGANKHKPINSKG